MLRLSSFRTAPVMVALAMIAAGSAILGAAPVAAASGERSDLPPRPAKKAGPKPPAPQECTPPANDDCANATVINTSTYTNTVDTTCATDETGEPASTCTDQGSSVWYKWTNTGTHYAIVNADTYPSAPMDTAMMAWTGSCANFAGFVPVACSDDDDGGGDGFQSAFSFLATPGQTYLFQVGGFGTPDEGKPGIRASRVGPLAVEVGSLTFDFTSQTLFCTPVVIHGGLGLGSPDHPSVAGNQTGRLDRDGVSSTCAAPKTCNPFDAVGGRAFDAYTFANASGAPQCVQVNLVENPGEGCNLQANAYLGTYDPANICTNYLADPGLSTGANPPTPISFSFTVPAGQSVVVVVHTTNAGESDCGYTLTVIGDLCGTTADLSITKTDGQTTAVPGTPITYTIVASNAGPANAPGSNVTDNLPATLTAVTWTCAPAGGAGCGAASGGGNINQTVNLPAGGSVTYTVHATISASATGSLANTATVATNGVVQDPTPGNNSATDTDTLASGADVSVHKSVVPPVANNGDTLTYTIVVSNAGPANASGVGVHDTFPPEVTNPTWTCTPTGGATCTASGTGNINDTVNLPAGSHVTYVATGVVHSTSTHNIVNSAFATMPAGLTDPTPADESSSVTAVGVAVATEDVPTLGVRGLALLAVLLMVAGAVALSRLRF